ARDAQPRRPEVHLLPDRILRHDAALERRAHRALQLEREVRHLLAERGADRLADRALGPGRGAARERGERAVAGELETLRLDVEVGELLAHRRVLERGVPLATRLLGELEQVAEADRAAA